MAWTTRYVSELGGGAHDGTTEADAYTFAEAIAAEAAGMRFNVKGAAANTTTSRTFAAVGTATAPILWEGYVNTPGDICGRVGVAANNALTKPVISFTTGQLVVSGTHHKLAGLDVTSAYVAGATGTISSTAGNFSILRCRVTNTGAHANARAFTGSTNVSMLLCYFSATATAATVVSLQGTAVGCTARGGIISFTFGGATPEAFMCVADSPTTTGFSIGTTGSGIIQNCSAYNCTNGILGTSATAFVNVVNGIFSTCTNGVNQSAGTNSSAFKVYGCSFYACTNPIVGVQECATAADDLFVQQGNAVLTVDPFVNAAGHDFTLNPASAARGAGIPGAFENEAYAAYTDAGAVGNARVWKRASERVAR